MVCKASPYYHMQNVESTASHQHQ